MRYDMVIDLAHICDVAFCGRKEMMTIISAEIKKNKWTQVQAGEKLLIDRPRVSDLMRGKCEKFSLDALLAFSARLGLQPKITLSRTV